MAKADVEFTWHELSKLKGQYVTRNAHLIAERTMELLDIQGDKNCLKLSDEADECHADSILKDDELEPKSTAIDNRVPGQIKTNLKEPMIPII